MTAQEDERSRSGHELQDEIAQTLLGLQSGCSRLKKEERTNTSGSQARNRQAQRLVFELARVNIVHQIAAKWRQGGWILGLVPALAFGLKNFTAQTGRQCPLDRLRRGWKQLETRQSEPCCSGGEEALNNVRATRKPAAVEGRDPEIAAQHLPESKRRRQIL